MTDELRIRIAKAFGFDHIRKGKRWSGTRVTIEYGQTRDEIPDWPGDVGSAMELANEFDLWTLEKKPDPLNFHSAYSFHGTGFWSDYQVSPVGGFGDTAAEAICQAWLAWKEPFNKTAQENAA